MFWRCTILSCAFLTLGLADTLYLKSGATIQGKYAGGDTVQVKIVVGDHTETYQRDEVLRLELSGTPTPTVAVEAGPVAVQPAGGPLEIPSGTNLIVRMIDNVDSDRDKVGQTYRASLDEPVLVNGQILVPRGSDVLVKLITQKDAGRFTGSNALTLDVMRILINGRMVDIVSSEVTQTAASRTRGTAVRTGGGAAVGALLGGVIGGGKGVVIGALAGGGLGAGSQVMTKGQKVKIPAETRLSFLLQQPLRY